MSADRDRPVEQARAIARDALASWRGENPDRAIEACDHALSLLLPVGPTEALADVLRWKGNVLKDRGSHASAVELYNQSLAVADASAYKAGRAHALNCLGSIAQYRGDLTEAERLYGEAARLAHRLADRRLSAMVQQNLGVLAEDQGRTDEAVAHFRLALAAFEQEEQRDAMLWVLNNLGVLYTREGALMRASESLDRARAIAAEIGDLASEGTIEENRSALYLAMGDVDAAELAAGRAYGIAEQRRDNARRAAALRAFARVTRARNGASEVAVNLLERALTLVELTEDVLLRAEVLFDLGDAVAAAGERTRAKEFWRRSADIARRAGFAVMSSELQGRLRASRPIQADSVHQPPAA